MADLIELLKKEVGYMTSPYTCCDCRFFKEDMSTDNFGPGDQCIRNPDIKFSVSDNGRCNKWAAVPDMRKGDCDV